VRVRAPLAEALQLTRLSKQQHGEQGEPNRRGKADVRADLVDEALD